MLSAARTGADREEGGALVRGRAKAAVEKKAKGPTMVGKPGTKAGRGGAAVAVDSPPASVLPGGKGGKQAKCVENSSLGREKAKPTNGPVKSTNAKVSGQQTHPHCLQALPLVNASSFHDILSHGKFPREKYVARNKSFTTSVLHRGQRKLLMSEMGALVRLDPAVQYFVVYAGAAPGNHIPLLSELFPNLTFHLYDPVPFEIEETDKIKSFNTWFTDEHAQAYASASHKHLVFISDIRRTNDERMVWEDMQAQKRWHEIMQPELTSLKFRLPWPGNGVAVASNLFNYLDGDIHLPVWGPCNTTESRLVIEQARHKGTRVYDCLAYKEEMCYFNRVTRPSVHQEQMQRRDGLDGCYDCTAECALLKTYARIWGHAQLTTGRISKELRRDISASKQAGVKQQHNVGKMRSYLERLFPESVSTGRYLSGDDVRGGDGRCYSLTVTLFIGRFEFLFAEEEAGTASFCTVFPLHSAGQCDIIFRKAGLRDAPSGGFIMDRPESFFHFIELFEQELKAQGALEEKRIAAIMVPECLGDSDGYVKFVLSDFDQGGRVFTADEQAEAFDCLLGGRVYLRDEADPSIRVKPFRKPELWDQCTFYLRSKSDPVTKAISHTAEAHGISETSGETIFRCAGSFPYFLRKLSRLL